MSNMPEAKPSGNPAPRKRRPRKKLVLPQDEEAIRQEQELKKKIAQSLFTQHSARSEVEALEDKKKSERINCLNGGGNTGGSIVNACFGAHNGEYTGKGVTNGEYRRSSMDMNEEQRMCKNANILPHQNSQQYMANTASGGQQGWENVRCRVGGVSCHGRGHEELNNGGVFFHNSHLGQFSQQHQQQPQLMLQQQRQDDFANTISREEIMLSLKQEANRIKGEALKLKAVLDQCKNFPMQQREGISPVYNTTPPHGGAGADKMHSRFSSSSHSPSDEMIYQNDRSANHEHSSKSSHPIGGMIRTSYKTPSPSPGRDGGSHQSINYNNSFQYYNSNGVDRRVYQTQSPSNHEGIPRPCSPSIFNRISHLNSSSSTSPGKDMFKYNGINTQPYPSSIFAEKDRNQYTSQIFDSLPVIDRRRMPRDNIDESNNGLRQQQNQKSAGQHQSKQSNYDFPNPLDKTLLPRNNTSRMRNSVETPTVSNVSQVPNIAQAPPPPFQEQQVYRHMWYNQQNQQSYQKRQQQRSDEFQPQSIQPRRSHSEIHDDDHRNSLTVQDISGGRLQHGLGHLSSSSFGGSSIAGQSGGLGDRNCSILSESIGTFHASASLRSSMQSSVGSLEFRGGGDEQDASKALTARNIPQNVALGIVREESERDFTSLSRRESEIERPNEMSDSVDRTSDLTQLCATAGVNSSLRGINGKANELGGRPGKGVTHQVCNSERKSFAASLMEGDLLDSNLFNDSKNLENMASLKSVDFMMSMDSMGFSRRSGMNMSLEELDEGSESAQSSNSGGGKSNSDQKQPPQNFGSKEKQWRRASSDRRRSNSYHSTHSRDSYANTVVIMSEISQWSTNNPFQNSGSNLDTSAVAHPSQHLSNRVSDTRQSLGDFEDFEGLEDVASIHEGADVNISMMSSMTDNDLTNSLKAIGLEHSRSQV